MSHRYSSYLVLAGALALALALACGDDDSPTGGGGGGNSTLSVPPGTYRASGGFYDCITHLPTATSVDTMVYCQNEVFNDFFGYDCAVVRSGNNLSVSCTRTTEMSTGCNETVVIDITGTVSGDHYELHGTLNYSDDPADCWDGTHCDSFAVALDRIGATPTACSYADEGTLEMTVTGGAQAGKHVLSMFASSDNLGGSIAFNFSGSSSVTLISAREMAAGGVNGIYLSGNTDYVNPASLPATLQVYINTPGARSPAAGGPQIGINYFESTSTYSFDAESATSGSFVVRELSDDAMAGTFTMTLAGTQYDEAYPSGAPAQRTVSGGYFITASTLTATRAPGVLERVFHRRGER